MRRRAQPDPCQQQLQLIDNASKPSWPVHAPGALLGPVSDERGGPLSALEAERVTRGASIAFAGHLYERGLLLCRGCADWQSPLAPGQGFRMTVYKGGSRDRFLGKCGTCGIAVVGENPRAASVGR